MSRSPLQANIIDVGDVLVIGAGLAGLFTALKLGARPVTVMAAGKRNKGAASKWAQGGIAAALGPDDSPACHAHD
ncbi:FAD-dependent oxidoreductase [Alphaproteobacteria bacterium]|nr:FAD-dependent oxidoreductase [Alphaproteobacteria bacterium]